MRYGPPANQGKQDTGYVSEFTDFMAHFLKEHPEEVREQRTGWFLYWDHKPHRSLDDEGHRESVPDDRYGFDYSAWHARSDSSKSNT